MNLKDVILHVFNSFSFEFNYSLHDSLGYFKYDIGFYHFGLRGGKNGEKNNWKKETLKKKLDQISSW